MSSLVPGLDTPGPSARAAIEMSPRRVMSLWVPPSLPMLCLPPQPPGSCPWHTLIAWETLKNDDSVLGPASPRSLFNIQGGWKEEREVTADIYD